MAALVKKCMIFICGGSSSSVICSVPFKDICTIELQVILFGSVPQTPVYHTVGPQLCSKIRHDTKEGAGSYVNSKLCPKPQVDGCHREEMHVFHLRWFIIVCHLFCPI